MSKRALVRDIYETEVDAKRDGDLIYATVKRQKAEGALRAEGIEPETFHALYAQAAAEHLIDTTELEVLTHDG